MKIQPEVEIEVMKIVFFHKGMCYFIFTFGIYILILCYYLYYV